MTPFLRPLQDLSPEVRDGVRRSGEVVFPDGYVLLPGEGFVATPVSFKTVWNLGQVDRWYRRQLVLPDEPTAVLAAEPFVVRTGLVEIDTAHGRATISLAGDQIEVVAVPIQVGGMNRSYTFQLGRFAGRQGDVELGAFWRWKTPTPAPPVLVNG